MIEDPNTPTEMCDANNLLVCLLAETQEHGFDTFKLVEVPNPDAIIKREGIVTIFFVGSFDPILELFSVKMPKRHTYLAILGNHTIIDEHTVSLFEVKELNSTSGGFFKNDLETDKCIVLKVEEIEYVDKYDKYVDWVKSTLLNIKQRNSKQ